MNAAGGRHRVIVTEALDDRAAQWLAERCEVSHIGVADEAALAAALASAAGLVVRTYTRVNAALLDRAPKLRVVGRAGVGLDNIDVAECRRRGVEVVHTPDANGQAVAEFVFALLLDGLRPRQYLTRAIGAAEWESRRRGLVAAKQLSELTLGILGLGKIGSRVARLGAAIGMPVIFHDLVEIPAERRSGATSVSREELLARADVLTLHVDSRPANRHLLGRAALELCRPGVVIVNTSRGMVVDAAALAEFLAKHTGAMALLDVHDPEPVSGDSPLLGLANARLTPHLAAATATAHANMSLVVRDVWRVLRGERPEFPAAQSGF